MLQQLRQKLCDVNKNVVLNACRTSLATLEFIADHRFVIDLLCFLSAHEGLCVFARKQKDRCLYVRASERRRGSAVVLVSLCVCLCRGCGQCKIRPLLLPAIKRPDDKETCFLDFTDVAQLSNRVSRAAFLEPATSAGIFRMIKELTQAH